MTRPREDNEEAEANYFAIELLMPRRFLVPDIREMGGLDLCDDSKVKALAKKYNVSVSMMAIRINQLVQE